MDMKETKISDANIQQAVREWCCDRKIAMKKFGHIRKWDTSTVTNMQGLFKNKRQFNDDISM